MSSPKKYVQYGCGLCAPAAWINFDASPTLRIQKTPVIGFLFEKKLNTVFPSNVKYGDIIKGLPNISPKSCDAVYCSHTLEHLSLNDFRIALKNTLKILKPGGTFRLVVPDLETLARSYVKKLDNRNSNASIEFIGRGTLLGTEKRQRGLKGMMVSVMGNANHLWMWDYLSMKAELEKCGFSEIKRCSFNDNSDEMFKLVEDKSRFEGALAVECKK